MSIVILVALLFAQVGAEPAPMKCDIGPIERDFGGSPWIVYSCEDGKSVVLVSGADNPAAPFVFIAHPDGEHYRIHGEGNGDKAASDRAGDALRALGDDGIRDLLRETRKPRPAR